MGDLTYFLGQFFGEWGQLCSPIFLELDKFGFGDDVGT